MNSDFHSSCPAEMHGARPATDALLLLYRRKEECALLHACARDTCPLGQEWPRRWIAAEDTGGWHLFRFIAVAFAGPRDSL